MQLNGTTQGVLFQTRLTTTEFQNVLQIQYALSIMYVAHLLAALIMYKLQFLVCQTFFLHSKKYTVQVYSIYI